MIWRLLVCSVSIATNGRVFLLWRQLKQKLQRITNINIMKNSETKDIQSHSRNTVLPAGLAKKKGTVPHENKFHVGNRQDG